MDAAFRKPSSNHSSDYAEEERRRQSDREAREKLRRTREETAAIQNSSYTDRYGSEHVIHSTDKYAYRKGDTYVTSNHPLDYGYDWEELDKKKY